MIWKTDQGTPPTKGGLMPLTLHWDDIALRLVLTIIAGTLVGIDRSERGQAADSEPRTSSAWPRPSP